MQSQLTLYSFKLCKIVSSLVDVYQHFLNIPTMSRYPNAWSTSEQCLPLEQEIFSIFEPRGSLFSKCGGTVLHKRYESAQQVMFTSDYRSLKSCRTVDGRQAYAYRKFDRPMFLYLNFWVAYLNVINDLVNFVLWQNKQ